MKSKLSEKNTALAMEIWRQVKDQIENAEIYSLQTTEAARERNETISFNIGNKVRVYLSITTDTLDDKF